MKAGVRTTLTRWPRLAIFEGQARKRCGKSLLGRGEECLTPKAVEDVFQTCTFTIGAVALVDEHAYHRQRYRHTLLGLKCHAKVSRKVAVSGDATHRDAKVNTFWQALARGHPHRAEANVVCILERRDRPAAVESNVELPRQPVELAVVQDRMVQRKPEGPRVI